MFRFRHLVARWSLLSWVAAVGCAPSPRAPSPRAPAADVGSRIEGSPTEASVPSPNVAHLATPEQRLRELLASLAQGSAPSRPTASRAVTDQFTETFLAKVGPAALDAVLSAMMAGVGDVREVHADDATERRARGTIHGTAGAPWRFDIIVEAAAPHRIEGLILRPASASPPAAVHAWQEVDDALRARAPKVAFLAAQVENGRCAPLHELDAHSPRAIGSTFKLLVLAAILEDVGAHKLAWSTPIPIVRELTVPFGDDETAKVVGEERSVAWLTRRMIVVSDNAATDHLLAHLGRERVEKVAARFAPDRRNVPLLSTREMTALKLVASADERSAYEKGTVAQRRALAAALARRLPPSVTPSDVAPVAIESIEWFASAAEVCRLLAYLTTFDGKPDAAEGLSILFDPPSSPDTKKLFDKMGYKGGSEAGVLSMSFVLRPRDQRRWLVLSATLNDPQRTFDMEGAARVIEGAVRFAARPLAP